MIHDDNLANNVISVINYNIPRAKIINKIDIVERMKTFVKFLKVSIRIILNLSLENIVESIQRNHRYLQILLEI